MFNPTPMAPLIPGPTRRVIDESNFRTEFKHCIHTQTQRLNSESAIKSYNGIYHNFILPATGDYAHNFRLHSPYLILGAKDSSTLGVDCVINYIESIAINLNNNTTIIAKVDQVPKVESLAMTQITPDCQNILPLNFFNLPLLTKYILRGNYQISIKFKKLPPTEYELVYDIMFTDDHNYDQTLRKEEFTVIYKGNKAIELTFKNGHVMAKAQGGT